MFNAMTNRFLGDEISEGWLPISFRLNSLFFKKKILRNAFSGIERNVQHWQMATPMTWQSSNKSNSNKPVGQWGTFDFCSSFYRSFETCIIKKQR